MRKLFIGIIVVLLLFSSLSVGAAGEVETISLKREIQATIDQAGQTHTLMVPVEPLEFDTTLDWTLTIDKKSLASEKRGAFMTIEPGIPDQKPIERFTDSNTGNLFIPKGTQYKIILFTGEYTRLFTTSGAGVSFKARYDEVLIKYNPTDRAYTFNFDLLGPSRFKEWRWIWNNSEASNGKSLRHQFSREGLNSILIEGKDNSLAQKYRFELNVPPLIVLDPQVGPLEGPVELNVTAKANATVNYGQKAEYVWNFGNGIELTGSEVGANYQVPGNYHLTLTARIGDYTVVKGWLVKVTPLMIIPNATVTPLVGPVPLELNTAVNPVVEGSPTKVVYTWLINGKPVEGQTVKRILSEPGDYAVTLKTEDKLHPDQAIPDQVWVVKALPPQLGVSLTVTAERGVVPLEVVFNPNSAVIGGPVDLRYQWDFGDGVQSVLEKPVHIYKQPGEYVVKLVLSDRLHLGNAIMATTKVVVFPPVLKPEASADSSSGLIPLTVKFNAQTAITGSPCEPQYFWDFGDGAQSYESNPVHTFRYEGNYTVTLEARNAIDPGNAVKTTLQIQTRLPKLRLTVALTPTSGKAPLSINGQTWVDKEGTANPKLKIDWDFGDGLSGTGMDVRHTFNKPGTYNVIVTVTDLELGMSEKKTVKVIIK